MRYWYAAYAVIGIVDVDLVPWRLRANMAYEVAAGMSYLHALKPSPIIHGDLKLQNVLLGRYFNAKVCLVFLWLTLCNYHKKTLLHSEYY